MFINSFEGVVLNCAGFENCRDFFLRKEHSYKAVVKILPNTSI